DQKHAQKIVFADGRRTELASVSPTVAQPRESKDEEVKAVNVLSKLRDIADPVGETLPRGVSAAIGKNRGNITPIRPPAATKQQEQLVFQGGASSGASGVYLTTQGHVSADGQFMRLSINPVFQPQAIGNGRPQLDVPLIPGIAGR